MVPTFLFVARRLADRSQPAERINRMPVGSVALFPRRRCQRASSGGYLPAGVAERGRNLCQRCHRSRALSISRVPPSIANRESNRWAVLGTPLGRRR